MEIKSYIAINIDAMNEQTIEQAVLKLLYTPELCKLIDTKLKYDLLNSEERKVSVGRKLQALFIAGMLEIKDGE